MEQRCYHPGMAKILIVEDDSVVAGLARDFLSRDKHVLELAGTYGDACERLRLSPFDLFIVDWQLPDGSGIEICDMLRKSGCSKPILLITGKGTISDKEIGYGSGADDYLAKPFDMRELRMKASALLRRAHNDLRSDVLSCGHVEVDLASGRVVSGGAEVRLQPQEFALLSFLMQNQGRLFTSEALLSRVWQSDEDVTDIALRTCIARLRKKLRIDGRADIIRTLPGFGYKIEGPSK